LHAACISASLSTHAPAKGVVVVAVEVAIVVVLVAVNVVSVCVVTDVVVVAFVVGFLVVVAGGKHALLS